MKLAHYYLPGSGRTWGVIVDDRVHPVAAEAGSGFAFLAALLQWPDPAAVLRSAVSASSGSISADLLRRNRPSGRRNEPTQ